jgi:hypothetical protein
MPRKPSSRKYLLTINNPLDHGFNHERIKTSLSGFSGLVYWCMCDEVGEQGTPHTHVYVVFKNSVMFDTMHKKFYGVHIDKANGSNQENRDYVRKEGKWADDAKHETNKPETFEESGELPPDKTKAQSQAEEIVQMIRDGMSNAEILEACPSAYSKLAYIEQTRQTLLQEQHKDAWRNVDVTYLWGDTGAGKTRSVMEKYGYSKVYRVTDYSHPFDSYKGQDVIVFEEFRSSIKVQDMLLYLDGYPLELPCRYANKVACYTKVYLITNIPLNKQYPNVQEESPETWDAFRRRIHHVDHLTTEYQVLPDDPDFDPDSIFGNKGVD